MRKDDILKRNRNQTGKCTAMVQQNLNQRQKRDTTQGTTGSEFHRYLPLEHYVHSHSFYIRNTRFNKQCMLNFTLVKVTYSENPYCTNRKF